MRHHDPKPVGLCEDLPLSRRVQLAVLAHIRHTHTRYDQLLRETRWENARKVVEKLCLDIIVRWRGDEETGRDQLDEILREVVVISDSEDSDLDDSDQDPTGSSSDGYQEVLQPQVTTPRDLAGLPALLDHPGLQPPQSTEYTLEGENDARILHERIANRNEQRGFKRYRAWEMALQRNRGELEISDANGQGNVRTVQDARASVIPEEAGPTTVFVGSVPNSNGFVPPQTPWSQPVLPHTGSHPGPPSTAPQNGQVMSVDDSRASWTSVVRQVSPSTHRLEDMLVRSIEPASPENQSHSSFMRPQQNLAELSSPIHYGMQHRPAQAGHDLRAWNISIPVERPFMSERAYQEVLSPGSRRVSYGMDHNPGHGYISQYNDPANSRLRSPVALTQPQMTGIPNVSNRTVIVNASRPGERSNPIFMEDRGGFFERVQTPSNGMRHHSIAAPERPSKWPNHPPHRTSGAPRGGTWDENSRVVGRGRDDPDIEMNPAPPVAGFSAESGFNMPRPRYSSPTQPQRPHDVSGYGQLRQVNPTPTYGATAYRPATDM